MSTLFIPATAASLGRLPEDWPDRLLVATDGRPQSDAAVHAARTLAGSVTFDVLSVIETDESEESNEADDGDIESSSDQSPVDARRALVDAQLRRVLGESSARITVRSGYPPAVLASFAVIHEASLLVVGLGRPRVRERLLGGESLYRLARMTRTPLFAVAAGAAVPSRRVIVATDFTASCARAATLALSVASFDAEVLLAHVSATDSPSADGRLRRLADSLQAGFCGRVKPVLLHGDPATELLALASERHADAIAFATHSHATSGSASLGAVASRLARCASCSIILMPA